MQNLLWRCSIGLTAMWLSGWVSAAGKPVKLATLEWPPYVSGSLPGQGAAVVVARAAFAAMGYELSIEVLPWSRAVNAGKSDDRFVGYFPEYDSAAFRSVCIASEPLGYGPLGLAQTKDRPIAWTNLNDLKRYRIGVVQDYVNVAELDASISSGTQKHDIAPDDSKNLLKLANDRVDAAVIDINVFNYLLRKDLALKPYTDKISMNSKMLEDKPLYICFRKGESGQHMAKLFNQGLKKIDIKAIMSNYLIQ